MNHTRLVIVCLGLLCGACGGDPSTSNATASTQPPPREDDAALTVALPAADPDRAPSGQARLAPRLWRERESEQDAWFRDQVVALESEGLGAESEGWLLDAWSWFLKRADAPSPADLRSRYEALPEDEREQPLLDAMAAAVNPEMPVAIAAARRVLAEGPGGPRPLSRAIVALRWLYLVDEGTADWNQCARDALQALETAAIAGRFDTDVGGGVLVAILSIRGGHELTDVFANRVANRLASLDAIPAWARATVIGECEVELAWRIRGAGWADSVTEAQWQGFRTHLERAAEAFQRAQALAPHRPEPWLGMITVAMGQGGDGALAALRSWLDRAWAVAPGHVGAAKRYLSAIRPRWYGSIDLMVETLLEWAAAGAADPASGKALAAFLAAVEIDAELGGNGAVWSHPPVSAALHELFTACLASADSPFDPFMVRSLAAVAAFKGGRFHDAQALFQDLPDGLHHEAVHHIDLDEGRIRGICELMAGPHAETVAALGQHGPSATVATVDDLLAEADLGPEARRVLESVKWSALDVQALDAGAWVPMRIEPGLPGWEAHRGAWTATEDGAEVAAGFEGHMVIWDVPIGPRFEIEGRIEVLETSNGVWQTGVVFGQPDMGSSNWASVRFRPSGTMATAELSRHFNAPIAKEGPAVLDDGALPFRIRVDDRTCRVWIGEREVLAAKLPEHVTLAADARVGLGAYFDDNESRIRYSSIRMRRLPTPAMP